MNSYLCIFICFTVGIIIYSLLKSNCSCDKIEGQETPTYAFTNSTPVITLAPAHVGGDLGQCSGTGGKAPLQTVTDTAPVNPAWEVEKSTYGKGKVTIATDCCGLYDDDAQNIYTEACDKKKFDTLPEGTHKRAISTQLDTYRTKLWTALGAERPLVCTGDWPGEPPTVCSQ